jgi:cyanate permease
MALYFAWGGLLTVILVLTGFGPMFLGLIIDTYYEHWTALFFLLASLAVAMANIFVSQYIAERRATGLK